MRNNLLILALALAALVLLGRKIEHLQQVIADQQEQMAHMTAAHKQVLNEANHQQQVIQDLHTYIEAGAHGRYQGEE